MKTKMIAFVSCIVLCAAMLAGCGGGSGEAYMMKFNSEFDYTKYAGKPVMARGYMATLSPPDGNFIYLMNVPYQNCPYCVPNSKTVVNTIAVYAKGGQKFDFTDGPIEVSGTLKVDDTTDGYGYQYSFYIADATYKKLSVSELSENLKMYGALAEEGIINDILITGGQIHFNSAFEDYGATAAEISKVSEAEVDGIIKKIKAISTNGYSELIAALENLKAVNRTINGNIDQKDYAANKAEDVANRIKGVYDEIYSWLNKFEI